MLDARKCHVIAIYDNQLLSTNEKSASRSLPEQGWESTSVRRMAALEVHLRRSDHVKSVYHPIDEHAMGCCTVLSGLHPTEKMTDSAWVRDVHVHLYILVAMAWKESFEVRKANWAMVHPENVLPLRGNHDPCRAPVNLDGLAVDLSVDEQQWRRLAFCMAL